MKPFEDNNKHLWGDRGTCVCPFICLKCSALSGTDQAVNKCLDNRPAKIKNTTVVYEVGEKK